MCEFIDKICPICGKKMCRVSWKNYAWKYENKYYCSYTCFRVDEKKRLKKFNNYSNK